MSDTNKLFPELLHRRGRKQKGYEVNVNASKSRYEARRKLLEVTGIGGVPEEEFKTQAGKVVFDGRYELPDRPVGYDPEDEDGPMWSISKDREWKAIMNAFCDARVGLGLASSGLKVDLLPKMREVSKQLNGLSEYLGKGGEPIPAGEVKLSDVVLDAISMIGSSGEDNWRETVELLGADLDNPREYMQFVEVLEDTRKKLEDARGDAVVAPLEDAWKLATEFFDDINKEGPPPEGPGRDLKVMKNHLISLRKLLKVKMKMSQPTLSPLKVMHLKMRLKLKVILRPLS